MLEPMEANTSLEFSSICVGPSFINIRHMINASLH